MMMQSSSLSWRQQVDRHAHINPSCRQPQIASYTMASVNCSLILKNIKVYGIAQNILTKISYQMKVDPRSYERNYMQLRKRA